MKNNGKKLPWIFVIAILAVLVIGFVLFLGGKKKEATFNGSKTGDENHYEISFSMLNTTYDHELVMSAGESILVHIEKEAGDIKIQIQKDQEEPIYEGNGELASDFEVTIPEDGTYTVSVTGKSAKGLVTFLREN